MTLLARILDHAAPTPPQPPAWYHDPVAFARECIQYPAGAELTAYQADVLSHLATNRRAAQRGPHGLGKTAVAAIAVHWFALTRDQAGIDWKVVTTAGGARQLERFFWPEIVLWANRLRWDIIGRRPYNRTTELLTLTLRLKHGSAFAVASDEPALIEGAHASEIFYIFDEAKAITAGTFDAAEGAFSVGAAYALASSTPGEPSGRFYDIHARKPGLEDWWTRHVTRDEVIAAGRMNPQWAAQRALQWGPDSQVYHNRVLGEFHTSDENNVIPLAWVEAAIDRWRTWQDITGGLAPAAVTVIGVDVARTGTDKTVIATRVGDIVTGIERHQHADTMETTGRVAAKLAHPSFVAVVDVIGIGAGVVDRLRELSKPVVAFNASAGSSNRDRTGELGFVNSRAAAWWRMRELLDPANQPTVALPDDDLLIGDLTAPHWKMTSTGRIQVESKDDIAKRIGRSTDTADAVIHAFWTNSAVSKPAHAFYRGLNPADADKWNPDTQTRPWWEEATA